MGAQRPVEMGPALEIGKVRGESLENRVTQTLEEIRRQQPLIDSRRTATIRRPGRRR